MTWFRMDDGFYRHRKVRRLGPDKVLAVGVWALAGDHSAEELSDGFVPHEVIRQWDPDGAMTARLIEVTLWEPDHVDGEDGIRFHDWLDYNPSREKVLADREKERLKKERMRAGLAEKRRKGRSTRPPGTPSGTPQSVPAGSPALPDPGSLPSSGTPAAAPVAPAAPSAVPAEHVPTSSPEARAEALRVASRSPSTRRRSRPAPPGARPLVAPVPRGRGGDPARAEQDRLAELDAVQAADAVSDERSPPDTSVSDQSADLQEQDTA